MKKLKVGVIGCGRISRFHGMPVLAQENAELKAVCDIVPQRAKEMVELLKRNAPVATVPSDPIRITSP